MAQPSPVQEGWCSVDNTFGPAATNCRGNFDFTLAFEESILSILPSALFLLIVPYRFLHVYRSSKKVRRSTLQFVKLINAVLYFALQIELLVRWARPSHLRTQFSLAAGTLSVLDAFAIGLLSFFYHNRSVRPSTLLQLHLSISLLFDVARTRTLWLVNSDGVLAAIFTTATISKAAMLCLETVEKRRILKPAFRNLIREATSGFANLSIFWWLNQPLKNGSKKVIALTDLDDLPEDFRSETLQLSLEETWKQASKNQKHALLLATAKTFHSSLLAGVFPRLCQTGFTYAQPFLINTLIKYLDSPEKNKNVGYALIGAYVIVFVGAAVSSGRSSHETLHATTKIRGALVTTIYSKTQKMHLTAVDGSSASTLMNTDVERISTTLKYIHSLWATPIELIIAIVLLERQIGAACAVPILLALGCSFISLWLSSLVGQRQGKWLVAIETRLNTTSTLLGSVKGIKMMGLTDLMASVIAKLRIEEMQAFKQFRGLQVISVVLSDVTITLGPVGMFAIFTIIAKVKYDPGLLTAQAFTSLTVLSLIGIPILVFVQIVPQFMAVVGCFTRIQEFLVSQSREDTRSFSPMLERFPVTARSQDAALELTELSRSRSSHGCAVSIANGAFGWSENSEAILEDVNINIKRGELAMIVGPVGSGKSTLLKAMLGETATSRGQINVSTSEVSFCDQTPWLMYGTIRENIIGMTEFDSVWYRRVMEVCALQKDIDDMPDGDQSIIGSRGLALSGGQKQRISIARAVYARNSLIIFDDVLAGLDATTEEHIFSQVFGSEGLLGKLSTTVILVTTRVRRMRSADKVIALGEGKILEQGSFEKLSLLDGYFSSISKLQEGGETSSEEKTIPLIPADAQKLNRPELSTAIEDPKRQTGDLTVYSYYFKLAGRLNILFTVTIEVASAFCVVFSTYWLQKWVEANSRRPNDNVGFYLGIYAFLGVAALVGLFLFCGHFGLVVVPRSGIKLHDKVVKATLGYMKSLLDINYALLAHLVTRAPFSFFTTTDFGVTMNRFSQDMQLVDSNLSFAATNTLEGLLGTVMRTILVCITAKYFAIVLPFALISVYLIQRYYLRTSRQVRLLDIEAKAPIYTQFLETMDGLATIRAFGWQHSLQRRNHELLDISQKPFYLLPCIQLWLTFALEIMTSLLAILVVVLAVTISKASNAGDAGVALVNVTSTNMVLAQLLISWTSLETSIGAVYRVRSFVQETPSEVNADAVQTPDEGWPRSGAISFEDVSTSYQPDSPAVLKNISMSIAKGEKIGVCGRTGGGKSSFILSLLQMLELNSGCIQIDDIDLSTISKEAVRSRITTVPQEAIFIEGTLRLNIDPQGAQTEESLILALGKVRLWDLIREKGGLDARAGDVHMSHGQQQLFCLARAMLKGGKILLLDEATSSVDVETNKLMQELIRSEFKDHTVVTVEHTLDNILDYDRIAVFDTGRLIELDSPSTLLGRSSAFKALYTS